MRPSAPAISRQTLLDEPRPGSLTIGYEPSEEAQPTENPPRFSWLPDIDDGARYVLRISTDPGFTDKKRSSSRISPGISSPRMKHCRTAIITGVMRYGIRNPQQRIPTGAPYAVSRSVKHCRKRRCPAGLPAMLPRKPATLGCGSTPSN